MNAHLFTHWTARGVVECSCGWSRKAKARTTAQAAFRQHTEKMGHLEGQQFLRVPRTKIVEPDTVEAA